MNMEELLIDQEPDGGEPASSRRQFLKLTTLAVGAAAVPTIVTLAPKEARAAGSWSTDWRDERCRGLRRLLGLCQRR